MPRWRSAERSRPRRGFTLLEVLVALVIIGVALTAALRGAMALTSSAEDTRLKLYASMAAENRVLELRLLRGRLEVGETVTECAQANIVFACTQVVGATPNPFFRRVEIRVDRASDSGRRRYAEMLTILPTQ